MGNKLIRVMPDLIQLITVFIIARMGGFPLLHHRHVELDNRIICFDIKELGKQLKKLGMLIVQDQVWNRVTINRNSKKNTRYYIDEFHLLLKEEQTAAYSVEIWKRFRKWGGVPTGITQNIKDLLASREIENIFENSDFIYMLNQASGDRQILEEEYFENCEWHIRALFEGERKMEDNQAKCEGAGRSNVCVSYHALSEDWSEIADRTINMLEKIPLLRISSAKYNIPV